MTTICDLLDVIRTHLGAFEVMEPWSVHVTSYSGGSRVSVQLAVREPSAIALGLLAWADTLTEVTAETWRPPHGDTMHLCVTGQLPGGVVVQVCGHLPFTRHGLGGDLAPDASKAVPLGLLRQWANPGEVSA